MLSHSEWISACERRDELYNSYNDYDTSEYLRLVQAIFEYEQYYFGVKTYNGEVTIDE